MRREYSCHVEIGQPQVAYRETITQSGPFNYLHKKQTGGSGQFGRVVGRLEPIADEEGHEEFAYEWQVTGGRIPTEYSSAIEKGFRQCMAKGRLIGFPVVGIRFIVEDGASHAVDSSDMAFIAAAKGAFREAYIKAKPVIMEPIMTVTLEGPAEHQGQMIRTINQRRGMIVNTTEEHGFARVESEVPLSEMFGYSTVLRSATQGTAEFTMEFAKYAQVPADFAKELRKQYEGKIPLDDE
jgi:elongation factor G